MPLNPEDQEFLLIGIQQLADGIRDRLGEAAYDAYVLALYRTGDPFQGLLWEKEANQGHKADLIPTVPEGAIR